MSVRETAAAAHEAATQSAEQFAAQQERARQAAARERNERAAITLERSPLMRWFPDATFDIIDYTGVGTSIQYQSDGTDIIVRSDDGVLFGLGYVSPTEVHVSCVELVEATGHYAHEGSYYSGPRVHGPEDVGAWLARRPT